MEQSRHRQNGPASASRGLRSGLEARSRKRRQPGLEPLESRCLLTSINDSFDPIAKAPFTEYEVHQQIRGYPPGYPFGANPPPGMYVPSSPNTIIVLDGVVEVFEKGLVRQRF